MIEENSEKISLAEVFMNEGKYKKALIKLNSIEESSPEIYRLKMDIHQKRLKEEVKYAKAFLEEGDKIRAGNMMTEAWVTIKCYELSSEKLGLDSNPEIPFEYYEIEGILSSENL